MKKITLLTIIISALALSSCFKTDPVVYGCTDICNVQSTALVSDYGPTYHVMEASSEDWRLKDRLYISFDVLETISESEYNIRLNEYNEYLVKSTLMKSTCSPDILGEDGVYANTAFISGKSPMLNIQCVYAHKKGSTSPHDINLVYDDTVSDANSITFHLTHNAFGDTYMEGVNIKDCESVAKGYSFPMSQYLQKGVGLIEIAIDYNWYKTLDNTATTELVKYTTSISVNY